MFAALRLLSWAESARGSASQPRREHSSKGSLSHPETAIGVPLSD